MVMVGEMRDLETMSAVLTLAETGHLVLSTLHTITAAETVNRIISQFPPDYERQIRQQLGQVLRGVVSQRLMQRSDEPGLIPAVEVLVGTLTVQRCIEEQSRTAQLSQVIAEGRDTYGMQSFNQSAIEWYQKGMVSYEEARRTATSQTDFEVEVERISHGPGRRHPEGRRRRCPDAGRLASSALLVPGRRARRGDLEALRAGRAGLLPSLAHPQGRQARHAGPGADLCRRDPHGGDPPGRGAGAGRERRGPARHRQGVLRDAGHPPGLRPSGRRRRRHRRAGRRREPGRCRLRHQLRRAAARYRPRRRRRGAAHRATDRRAGRGRAFGCGIHGPGSRSRPRSCGGGRSREGAAWAVARGYGDADDLGRIESHGCLPGADPDAVSTKAYERGRSQLGTLGSGNHFLEVQAVETVFLPDVARVLGLEEGRLTVMIHTGSRGFGHQVCTDALGVMQGAMRRYEITLPDRQLACAPLSSPEARSYLGAMRAAANFAFANRQCLAHLAREAVERSLGVSPRELGWRLVYDVAHNIAKEEDHEVDGRARRLLVHRKGATRAFPPGHPELTEAYRKVGQPVLIPGDMGRYSYVLVGAPGAMRETFGSTCHGAGRVLSRTAAVRAARGRSIADELRARGIVARAGGRESLAEEMSEAYKDVRNVVDVVERAGLSRVVARLRPLGVVKG